MHGYYWYCETCEDGWYGGGYGVEEFCPYCYSGWGEGWSCTSYYEYSTCSHKTLDRGEKELVSCSICNGTGKVEKLCDTCLGNGNLKGYQCSECNIINSSYSREMCGCGSLNVKKNGQYTYPDGIPLYDCEDCNNDNIITDYSSDKVKYNKCGHTVEMDSTPQKVEVVCTDCNGTGKGN